MPRIRGNEDQRRKIARRIKLEREQSGISQAAAGAACGCSRQNYMKMERGDNRIRAEMLLALAEAFGCDSKWFLTDRPAT